MNKYPVRILYNIWIPSSTSASARLLLVRSYSHSHVNNTAKPLIKLVQELASSTSISYELWLVLFGVYNQPLCDQPDAGILLVVIYFQREERIQPVPPNKQGVQFCSIHLAKSKLLNVTARLFLVYICRVGRSIAAGNGRDATKAIQHYKSDKWGSKSETRDGKGNRAHLRRTVGRFT